MLQCSSSDRLRHLHISKPKVIFMYNLPPDLLAYYYFYFMNQIILAYTWEANVKDHNVAFVTKAGNGETLGNITYFE